LVRDYPGRPVPEETFTRSHPSWSSDIHYQLPPFTTIHSILFVQFTCLTVLFDNLSWSSLVFLLVLDPLLHTLCISSPNHRLLFAAHANTIAAFSAVILMLSSIPSPSLGSLLGSLSFSLMPHIHLTILISARLSATRTQTTHTHTHKLLLCGCQSFIKESYLLYTRLTALCPGLPGWAGTRKVKQICILLKQETVSGSRISWAVCKSAPRSRQITTPALHHSVFYRPDALPAAQPTPSKHWRQTGTQTTRLLIEHCSR